ncbi:MAG: glutamate racemase [Fidelibacterota bacterium]
MPSSLPIGVFDSGLGGLTVVHALSKKLPGENIIYFGDTAHIPYGTKSTETVTHFSRQITDFLSRREVKLIVVACNTASAVALSMIQKDYTIPMIGVIAPGAAAAAATTQSGHVGIIGTSSTVASKAYTTELHAINKHLKVTGIACPLFVPLVEEGWTTGEIPLKVAQIYLAPFSQNAVDTVILGCTHYPLLKETIQSILPPRVRLIDSSEAVSETVVKLLTKNNEMTSKDSGGTLTCYVTDMPQKFEELGRRFLGSNLNDVSLVHLDW